MSLIDALDKKLKLKCTRLIKTSEGFKCLCMVGPPPLIAKMFESWEDTWDAYCERCTRFSYYGVWHFDHILKERERLWRVAHKS